MTRVRVAAALACLLAALAVAAVVVPWPDPALRPQAACPALTELSHALTLADMGDQAVVRARAARLADALERGEADDTATAAQRSAMARRITALLDDPTATVDDLVMALQPVAAACGATLEAQPQGAG